MTSCLMTYVMFYNAISPREKLTDLTVDSIATSLAVNFIENSTGGGK